jgi:sarcosine oxidase subunit beta
MSSLPARAAAVVIGGGVMGASSLYHLARAGLHDALLLEREPFFGQGATGRCAGGIRYQFGSAINIRLSQLSLPMLEAFADEPGQAIDIRHCGYLFVLSREPDVAAFRRALALQAELGVATEWLDGDEIRRRLPLMQLDDVLGGTWNPRDGLADPNGVVMGYIAGARRLGAQALTDIDVVGIEQTGGRVSAVLTSQGRIATPVAVNTAGPWAAAIGRLAGIELPIVPVRRQWLLTTPLPEIPPDFPMVIDFARALYFHREGEGILTGMSNPEERPGDDQRVDLDWELVAMEAACARLPLLERAGPAARVAGLYEVTPDAHPILGATPLPGFYVCAGFSGHGFMHGPICGLLMAEEIVAGRATTLDIAPLRLGRFTGGAARPEPNVV